jgi:serine/threonine kinase 3
LSTIYRATMAAAAVVDPSAEFELLERIGKGQFGEVWKALHKKTNKLLAIKKILPGAAMSDLTKEITILKKCVSPFIVRYYGNYNHQGLMWIVMEYCSLGSLNDIMVITGKTLSEVQIATVCKAMLEGLHFMQSQAKIHRDIKPHNVLINKYGAAKLCDFGISSDLEPGALRKTVIGTPYYLAPEVLKDQGYDYKADIWALGISAIEMAEKDPPYADLHPMRVLFVLANNPSPKLTHEEHWSPEFNSFVRACLELNPEKRPFAGDLLNHPFLRKSNPDKLGPLIQAALDAIDRHGGLEKAVEAMKPKPEEEGETEQDAADKDLNDDMLAGSGALLTLDSPGTTTGTSLVMGSSDDEDDDDFFDDFGSDCSDDSVEEIDIDDLLGDLGDDGSAATSKKSRKSNASSLSSSSASNATKPTNTIVPGSLGVPSLALDLTGLTDSKKTGPEPTTPHKSSRTPRTRREAEAKLKIQMGANGQIFGASPEVMTARVQEAPATVSSGDLGSILAEIDWKGLEKDAREEEEAEKRRKEKEEVVLEKSSGATGASSSAVSATQKTASTIDWSKPMAALQEELKSTATKRHIRGTGSSSSSSGNYEELLAELDVMGRRSTTPDRERGARNVLVARAFEREFPVSTPVGMKGDWVGRFEGPNPFRNNPQFVLTVEKPTQVLVTLRQMQSSRTNAPLHTISVHVFQVRDIVQSFPEMPSYGAVLEAERVAERQVCTAGLLEEISSEAKYVIVPLVHELTLQENCAFELEIKVANPEAKPKIDLVPTLSMKMARGQWTEMTAGGSAAYPSWRLNPQYHIKVHRATDMHMFLTQHTKLPEHLGCYIVRSDDGRFVMRLSQSRLINNDLKFRKRVEIASGRLQLMPGSYIVIPATYEPGRISPFTLSFLTSQANSYDLELVEPPFTRAFNGKWTQETAGGCLNHGSWIKNPKYSLSVVKPTQLSFVLGLPPHQYHHHHHHSHTPRTPKQATLAPPNATPEDPLIGFYLFRGNRGNAARLLRKDVVGRTKHFTDAREVVETIRLEPGAYILVPCTYQPNIHIDYQVQIHAESELEGVSFIEETLIQLEGAWQGPSAGGNFSHPSWRLNPQYLVTSSSECSVVVSLEQAPKATTEELPFISVAVIRPSDTTLIASTAPTQPSSAQATTSAATSSIKALTRTIDSKLFVLAPQDVASLPQFSNVFRQTSIPVSISPTQPLVLLPMTMTPNVETSFKIGVNHKDVKLVQLPDNLYTKVVSGDWSKTASTAGGCMNNRETWLQNPKFRFATKKPGLLRFVMQQFATAAPTAAPSAAQGSQKPAAPQIPPGGFYIFKSPTGQVANLSRQDFVGKSEFASTKEVRAQFEFEVGIYCIILTKFEPGAEGKFNLHLFAPHTEIAIGSMKS